MKKNATYKIYTLGCKVNQYDSGFLGKELERRGFAGVSGNANLAIVNTCAVTKTAISKAKQMLKKARKENEKAKIVLMGCWPKAYWEEASRFNADLIWPVGNIPKLARKIKNMDLGQSGGEKIEQTEKPNRRSRYFLKIQDGCEQFCAYCIIPYTRGKLMSRTPEEVIAEAKAAVKNGYEEIVLSGIHLGLYGIDFEKKIDLAVLLKEILKIENLGRVRLSSIEVNEVTVELLRLIKNNSKLCRYLHIPLQAGSDRILRSMNRPYNMDHFKNKIMDIKKQIPDMAISTDIIVGFPGEAENDFKESVEAIKRLKFSRLHVFPFSPHEKTPAAKMHETASSNLKKARSEELRKISVQLEEAYINKIKTKYKELFVLVEKKANGLWTGKSEFYFDVNFSGKQIKNKNNQNLLGKLIKVYF